LRNRGTDLGGATVNRPHLYILVDGEPVAVDHTKLEELLRWGHWYGSGDRSVARTELADGVWVSTIFLGVDASFGRDGENPILWETMVFGQGQYDQCRRRYRSLADAKIGHEEIVELVKRELSHAE
jgi:hypothetical protein